MTSPDMNVILKDAVASSVIFFSATTTAALHWFLLRALGDEFLEDEAQNLPFAPLDSYLFEIYQPPKSYLCLLRRVSACLNVDLEAPNPSKLKSNGSKKVIEEEGKVLVGTYARALVVLSSGKGCKLYDPEGREFLDCAAGIAVNVLGHGDPDWVRAVTKQANVLTHVSNAYYSIPQVELAKRLVGNSFADRVFFTNSGTEANEAAIKFSRKFQRFTHPDDKQPVTDFISFTNSFHGRTMGALALTSKEHYRSPFEPVMPGVTFLEYGNIQAAKDLIQHGKIAAVFVEPIQGEGGIYSATKEFLQALRKACDDAGSLLVFDEVQCGLGRTGYLWAHEAYGVFPDMMTLAKPLAGGLPIGATLVTERVACAVVHGDHGSTFAGSPLVCSAAIAVLDKIADPSFLSSVSKKGHYFKKLLIQKLGGNPHVKEVRGLGLIIGIELDVSASPLVDACRNSGLIILTAGKGNVVRLVPPLIISEKELEHAAEILKECLPALDGIEFSFQQMPMGGAALDLTDVPLPEETLSAAQKADAWDKNEKHLKPETGLLQLREWLKVFANLRPATVLPQASMFWRERVSAIASEYPDVELSHMYVDNAAMQLVRYPKQFDTIVTNNIFGDILSDEASMITGSIGMLPSASLGESDKANPLATILSAAMLLKYGLGEANAAKRIENAVLDTLNRGFRTGDIYSTGNKLVGCKEMGEEVLKSVDSSVPAAI
ncbi:hypothetical protein REPUB_Repub13aG0151000 [Reevesia pubescens]